MKRHRLRPAQAAPDQVGHVAPLLHGHRRQARQRYAIPTTQANELMRSLHDRMPVIINPASDALWLDPRSSADALRALLVPYGSEGMEASPVSPWVNNPKHEGRQCLEFVGA
jgi:putative SOS response-associated peptidase YedK